MRISLQFSVIRSLLSYCYIFILQGDLEKAITFYGSSLALQPSFEPARSRLQSVLCSLLFDSHTVKTGP